MDINWTTVIAAAVTASIVGGTQFIAIRYLGRILDNIERRTKDRLEIKDEPRKE